MRKYLKLIQFIEQKIQVNFSLESFILNLINPFINQNVIKFMKNLMFF